MFKYFGFLLTVTYFLVSITFSERPPPTSLADGVIWRCVTPLGQQWNQIIGDNSTFLSNCEPQWTNITVIMHGWRQGFLTTWVPGLIENFRKGKNRNSCTIFMDYSLYSHDPGYGLLLSQYNDLATELHRMLHFVSEMGYDMDKVWLWGHSFGAQLALGGGYLFGPSSIGRIDACDPAGPGFLPYAFPPNVSHISAKTVQIIHTSFDYGTGYRYGQFNMNMGVCGLYQAAASLEITSHGLCPYFYNQTFEHDFVAVPKPPECWFLDPAPNVTVLPRITMGFYFNESSPPGNYFFPTYLWPYYQPPSSALN